MSDKPWSGRFSLPTDKFVEEFNASIFFDKRLYKFDINGSLAHAEMLASAGILAKDEAETISEGLRAVLKEIDDGSFTFRVEDEDIHMAVEKRLTEIIGPLGGKLHTARSRNDQVATDFKMYVRMEVIEISKFLLQLMTVLGKRAEENLDVVMPGFTHLQTAQPILFSHWLMAYFQMFKRDVSRLRDCMKRLNYSPLGAAALAGTTFPIDRFMTAGLLGFTNPTENSLDSVSDRDFAIEFLSACAITQMHLSRLSEELIIYSTSEFKFIELSDDFCTGSSIMPNKKNPDMPELIRGKTGRVYGDLVSLLTTMKGLPLAYNKDMQEDKEPVFDAADTLKASLKIFVPMMDKFSVNEDAMKQAAAYGFSTATDLADYLVRKGVPFRESHHVVGAIVGEALAAGCDISELQLDVMKRYSDQIESDVFDAITVVASVNARNSYGGTAREAVIEQIKKAKEFLYAQA